VRYIGYLPWFVDIGTHKLWFKKSRGHIYTLIFGKILDDYVSNGHLLIGTRISIQMFLRQKNITKMQISANRAQESGCQHLWWPLSMQRPASFKLKWQLTLNWGVFSEWVSLFHAALNTRGTKSSRHTRNSSCWESELRYPWDSLSCRRKRSAGDARGE